MAPEPPQFTLAEYGEDRGNAFVTMTLDLPLLDPGGPYNTAAWSVIIEDSIRAVTSVEWLNPLQVRVHIGAVIDTDPGNHFDYQIAVGGTLLTGENGLQVQTVFGFPIIGP